MLNKTDTNTESQRTQSAAK